MSVTDDPPTAFIVAACVPPESGHSSGTLEQAEAILAVHPEIATHDIHTAPILGDDATVRMFLALDAGNARAKGRRLRGKVEAGDVVQQALLRAFAAWPELKDSDAPVLAAWLRRILARTLADLAKHYGREKRAVDVERLSRRCTGPGGHVGLS